MTWPFSRKAGSRARKSSRTDARREAPLPLSSLLLGLLFFVSVIVLLYSSGNRPYSNLSVGQRAPLTVVASADFSCDDIARTELNRRQAANAVPPVFSISYGGYNTAARSLDKLFGRLAQVREAEAAGQPRRDSEREMVTVIDLLGLTLKPEDVDHLAPPGHEEQVLSIVKSVLRNTWNAGIVTDEERDSAFQGIAPGGRITIRNSEGVLQESVALDDLRLPDAALKLALSNMVERLEGMAVSRTALATLLQPWIANNLVYDPRATDERRKLAEQNVQPVTMKVRAGTTLIEAGDRVTPQILEQLTAHEERRAQLESDYDRLVKRIGSAGLLVAALIACIGLLELVRPEVLRQDSRILLLIVLSLLGLLPARLVLSLSTTAHVLPPSIAEFALPVGLAPLLASILLGSTVAVALGLWTSFAMAVLFEYNFNVFTLGLVVTVIAALTTRDVRRRSNIYRAGLFVGLAEVLYAISIAAVRQQSVAVVAAQAGAGLASGLVCAFLVSLLIPLFEIVFGITTNLTLLELSDMGNPLLQRLAMEAPGTYHHSIVVANLGQAAAARIGANPLLVRVGAYFHDVGKLAKPEFFAENSQLRNNPHDELTPSMSALVIMSHVKEGLSLVRRYKLPRCVFDAVEQHHGTGVVSYFYHRARQQDGAAGGQAVNEEDYRYDGPRPRTREVAILSLADAVEAAARSLEKPSPTRIEGLVDDIVDSRIRDGQLDECPLTLADLAEIKRSFVFTLANMLHVRIAYPSDETETAQPAGKASSTHAGASPADRAPADDRGTGRAG